MADRSKYEKLDDIGFVGQQEKKSATSRKDHQAKTGKAFRKARAGAKSGAIKRTRSRSSM